MAAAMRTSRRPNPCLQSGPCFLLPTGPVSSFVVLSDPNLAKHVLRASDNPSNNIYGKGLVTEVSQFLFGQGFAVSQGEEWRVRRKVMAVSVLSRQLPSLKWLGNVETAVQDLQPALTSSLRKAAPRHESG